MICSRRGRKALQLFFTYSAVILWSQARYTAAFRDASVLWAFLFDSDSRTDQTEKSRGLASGEEGGY